MPVVDVVNLDGKKVGQVELADAVFGAKVNPHLLHEASRWYLRGLRAGTHKTKDKSEVSGASRNLERVKLVASNVLQPYDLLNHDLLVLSKDAVARLSHTLDPERTPIVAPDVQSIAPAPKPKKEVAPKAAAKPAAKKEKSGAKKASSAKKKGKE